MKSVERALLSICWLVKLLIRAKGGFIQLKQLFVNKVSCLLIYYRG